MKWIRVYVRVIRCITPRVEPRGLRHAGAVVTAKGEVHAARALEVADDAEQSRVVRGGAPGRASEEAVDSIGNIRSRFERKYKFAQEVRTQ